MSELMARIAKLDHDQVYWGLGEPFALARMNDDGESVFYHSRLNKGDRVFGAPELKHLVEDAMKHGELEDVAYIERDCDLPGGKYKLVAPDGEHPHWRFEPLPPHLHKTGEEAPDHERALYELCRFRHGIGDELPKATLDWCVAWERSFDNITADGVDQADGRGKFDHFRVAAGLLKPRDEKKGAA